MGILNVTPDSFSDGGRWADPERAIARGLELVAAGADVIDVGGESSRPGAVPVSEAEERRRVLGVVEALSPHVRVSIDTVKPAVAEAAAAVGATLVNDVSAELAPVAAALGIGWVALHRQGSPATMQRAPVYRDVVGEVTAFLRRRAEAAAEAGVGEIYLDPGIGFGKRLVHNLALLANLDRLVALGWPVLVGTSRKHFLGLLTAEAAGPPPPTDRLEPSLATAAWCLLAGVAMVRVHDVGPTVDLVRLIEAVRPAEEAR